MIHFAGNRQHTDRDAIERARWEREDTLDPVARLAAQPAVLRALREMAKADLRARIRAARSTRERVTRQRMWARRYGTEAA